MSNSQPNKMSVAEMLAAARHSVEESARIADSNEQARLPAANRQSTFFFLRELVPAGFSKTDLATSQGRRIVADWWEEHGDVRKAQTLREGRLLEPHFPVAMAWTEIVVR